MRFRVVLTEQNPKETERGLRESGPSRVRCPLSSFRTSVSDNQLPTARTLSTPQTHRLSSTTSMPRVTELWTSLTLYAVESEENFSLSYEVLVINSNTRWRNAI